MSSFLPEIVQENFKVIKKMFDSEYRIYFLIKFFTKALVAGYLGSVSESLKDYYNKQANKSSQNEVIKLFKMKILIYFNFWNHNRQLKIVKIV